MEFIKYDLGPLEKGRIVEITLEENGAYVRLLDKANFDNYKNGKKCTYIGGLITKSSVRMKTSHSDHWYVAIDMGGLNGKVNTTARILPQTFSKSDQCPLSELPSLVHNSGFVMYQDAGIKPRYDVFISYASADRHDAAQPLAHALKRKGLKVWYDEFELGIDDSLLIKIDKGLANSRMGIVIVSHSFIKKGWTDQELNGIFTNVVTGEQILLPIWHNITGKEAIGYSLSFADKVTRNTAVDRIDDIADEIAGLILTR